MTRLVQRSARSQDEFQHGLLASLGSWARVTVTLLAVFVAALPTRPSGAQSGDSYKAKRHQMVERQLIDRDITDRRLLLAMGSVERHKFVPPELRSRAYDDEALRVSDELSIHQPYVVALMTSLLNLNQASKVLEIGTGTGYHSAVLSKLAFQVFSMEIDPKVAEKARANLRRMGVRNVHVKAGDGYQGWPAEAPFDAIILTAAPPRIPHLLIDQLRRGGVMVVPVGTEIQQLIVLTKTNNGIEKRTTVPVKLPRMSGEVQEPPARP